MPNEKAMPETLTDEIIQLLRRVKAASVGELADATTLDRDAVREALTHLQQEGLVNVRQSSTVPDEIAVATYKLLRGT